MTAATHAGDLGGRWSCARRWPAWSTGGTSRADEMAAVVGRIMDGEATPAQVGALLTALRMKGETVDEVVGAARAMRARMLKVEASAAACWTPAAPAGTARARSTSPPLASFIVAGAGVRVAKHGNRALSSRAGVARRARGAGDRPGAQPGSWPRAAWPRPASASCSRRCTTPPPRRWPGPGGRSGFRTLFNLLGPLTNPAGARFHLNGVFAAERCEFLARAHQALGSPAGAGGARHGRPGRDRAARARPRWPSWARTATFATLRDHARPTSACPRPTRPG